MQHPNLADSLGTRLINLHFTTMPKEKMLCSQGKKIISHVFEYFVGLEKYTACWSRCFNKNVGGYQLVIFYGYHFVLESS